MVINYSGNVIVTTINTKTNVTKNTTYKLTVAVDVVAGTNNNSYKMKLTSTFVNGTLVAYKKYDNLIFDDFSPSEPDDGITYNAFYDSTTYNFVITNSNKLIVQSSGTKTDTQYVLNGTLNMI